MHVRRHDLPENTIVDAKIFVTKTVADAFDLAPGFRWKIGEPVLGNTTYGFRYGLNCVCGRAARDRIITKLMQSLLGRDSVQDRNFGEAVPDRDRRVLRHYVTLRASRSMFSFISG